MIKEETKKDMLYLKKTLSSTQNDILDLKSSITSIQTNILSVSETLKFSGRWALKLHFS